MYIVWWAQKTWATFEVGILFEAPRMILSSEWRKALPLSSPWRKASPYVQVGSEGCSTSQLSDRRSVIDYKVKVVETTTHSSHPRWRKNGGYEVHTKIDGSLEKNSGSSVKGGRNGFAERGRVIKHSSQITGQSRGRDNMFTTERRVK